MVSKLGFRTSVVLCTGGRGVGVGVGDSELVELGSGAELEVWISAVDSSVDVELAGLLEGSGVAEGVLEGDAVLETSLVVSGSRDAELELSIDGPGVEEAASVELVDSMEMVLELSGVEVGDELVVMSEEEEDSKLEEDGSMSGMEEERRVSVVVLVGSGGGLGVSDGLNVSDGEGVSEKEGLSDGEGLAGGEGLSDAEGVSDGEGVTEAETLSDEVEVCKFKRVSEVLALSDAELTSSVVELCASNGKLVSWEVKLGVVDADADIANDVLKVSTVELVPFEDKLDEAGRDVLEVVPISLVVDDNVETNEAWLLAATDEEEAGEEDEGRDEELCRTALEDVDERALDSVDDGEGALDSEAELEVEDLTAGANEEDDEVSRVEVAEDKLREADELGLGRGKGVLDEAPPTREDEADDDERLLDLKEAVVLARLDDTVDVVDVGAPLDVVLTLVLRTGEDN